MSLKIPPAAASGVVPGDTFTVTQAINNIGFGRFHILILLFSPLVCLIFLIIFITIALGRFQILLSFVVGLCWMADR